MKISLENKVVGRTIVVEASDTFMQNPDDIRIIAGTDCYKLVSTKSDIDKKREVLGLEFANEVFPEIQTKNPKTYEELEKLFNEKLDTEKYKELKEISEYKMLMMTLVTSYKRYSELSNHMQSLYNKIHSTIIEKNVFFDYIARLRKLISESKTLKDFHDGVFELKEMSHCDDRIEVGTSTIFECVADIIEEEQNLINEINETNNHKNIKDLPIFTDADFWISRFGEKCESSIKKLDELREFWKGYEAKCNMDPTGKNKFEFMLNELYLASKPVIECSLKLKEAVKADNDAVAIEHARDNMHVALAEYHKQMRKIDIMECLDSRKYSCPEEATFVDGRIAEYKELEIAAMECNGTGEKFSGNEYISRLMINFQVYIGILKNAIDVKKLIRGEYGDDEFKKILESL